VRDKQQALVACVKSSLFLQKIIVGLADSIQVHGWAQKTQSTTGADHKMKGDLKRLHDSLQQKKLAQQI